MTVPLSEAKSRLDELIAQLQPGEELVLTDDANQPVARVVGESRTAQMQRPREFPKLRHYAAAPVSLAVAAISTAVCGLLGAEPRIGFASGLLVSVVLISVAFAVAHPEAD
jgi:antitoxin (DNA-binding transcriptional repressor) of toxin-antitoxin stability system